MGRELGYSGEQLQTFVKEEKAEIRQREKELLLYSTKVCIHDFREDGLTIVPMFIVRMAWTLFSLLLRLEQGQRNSSFFL